MSDFVFELDLPPGLNSDDTSFAAMGQWADGNNVRFVEGRPQTIGNINANGYTGLGGSVSAMLAVKRGATNSIYFGSTTKLWAGATDITPAALGTVEKWSLQMYGSTLMASPNGGKLYKYTGSGVATAVTQAPVAISCMIVNGKRQVLALGCNEEISGTFNGRCIRGCDLEDFTDWTVSAANNAFEHIIDSDTDIVTGCTVGDYEIVWTASSMFLGQFIGDPSQTYHFEKVADVGIVAQKAFAITPDGLYFLGQDYRLYSWAAGSQPAPVPCPIFIEFFNNANRDESQRPSVVLGYLSSFNEVWVFYPDNRDGQPTGYNTRYIAFSIKETAAARRPVWFRGQLGRTAIIEGGVVNSFANGGCLMADDSGNVHFHEMQRSVGIAPASYTQSADQYIDKARRRMMVKGVKPDFEYQIGSGSVASGNVSLTLYARDYPGSAGVVTKGPYTLTAEASGYLVNDTVASGDSTVVVDAGTGGIAAGRIITFAGVNEWNGADTGILKRFTLASDFAGDAGTITLTEAFVSSGGSRNVVALPADNAPVAVLGTAAKKDFRASGKVLAVKFAGEAYVSYRIGKPVFDTVPLGER